MKALAYISLTGDFDEDSMSIDEKEEMLHDFIYDAAESWNVTAKIGVVEFIKD